MSVYSMTVCRFWVCGISVCLRPKFEMSVCRMSVINVCLGNNCVALISFLWWHLFSAMPLRGISVCDICLGDVCVLDAQVRDSCVQNVCVRNALFPSAGCFTIRCHCLRWLCARCLCCGCISGVSVLYVCVYNVCLQELMNQWLKLMI